MMPQNTTQDTRTTCEKFADRVQQLANAASSVSDLLDQMARTFMMQPDVDPANASLSEIRAADAGVLTGEAAEYSRTDGMRPDLAGTEGAQFRHFTAALTAATYSFGTVVMNSGEMNAATVVPRRLMDPDSVADRALNGVASYIYNTVFFETTRIGFEWVREPASIETLRNTLADEIRRDLCTK